MSVVIRCVLVITVDPRLSAAPRHADLRVSEASGRSEHSCFGGRFLSTLTKNSLLQGIAAACNDDCPSTPFPLDLASVMSPHGGDVQEGPSSHVMSPNVAQASSSSHGMSPNVRSRPELVPVAAPMPRQPLSSLLSTAPPVSSSPSITMPASSSQLLTSVPGGEIQAQVVSSQLTAGLTVHGPGGDASEAAAPWPSQTHQESIPLPAAATRSSIQVSVPPPSSSPALLPTAPHTGSVGAAAPMAPGEVSSSHLTA